MKETKFKQTEVGMIPSDWEVKLLGEITDVRDGTHDSPKYYDIGYKFVTSKNLINGKIVFSNIQYISKIDFDKINERSKVDINDILFAMIGTIGNPVLITKEPDFAIKNVALFKDKRCTNQAYLKFYLSSALALNRMLDDAKGSNQKFIPLSYFRSFLVPLPPTIEEQQRIANVLSDVDTLINNLEKLIAKKKNIKQGAMQQLLTGKQRLSGFDGVWEYDKLGNIAEMNSGGTPSSENSHYYGGKIPFLSISDMTKSGKYIFVTEKSITQLGLDNSSARVYPAGTLLYAMYASLGKCSISKIDLAISQAILGFKLSNLIDRDFMYYYFCFIENTIKNIGQTGTQSNLSKSIVENFEIYHPHDVSEQQAIAKILSDMDTEIATLETKLAKYRKLKTGMMQQLLTGKIRLL